MIRGRYLSEEDRKKIKEEKEKEKRYSQYFFEAKHRMKKSRK